MNELEIRRLDASHAEDVMALLESGPPDYRRYFEADPGAIATAVATAVEDPYWGIFVGGALAALVMLRGLDAGFAAPAFGVFVADAHSGRGLGRLALSLAQAWCAANGCTEIMLSVHPENERARHMYERDGFVADGTRSELGHVIYRKGLTAE